MAVYRVERTRDYTVMSNYHLKDTSLSLKAKGLLSMFLSFPEDWNYSTRGLAAICKEGVDAIGSTIKELEKAGYIIRRQLRGANGRITDTEYIIYEKPQPQEPPAPDADEPDMPPPDTASPHTENPDVAGPDMAAPHTENPAQLNINQFKTQKSNTQRSNTHSFPPPAPSETPAQPVEGMKEIFEKRDEIRDQIEYDLIVTPSNREQLNEFVEIMLEVALSRTPTMKIGRTQNILRPSSGSGSSRSPPPTSRRCWTASRKTPPAFGTPGLIFWRRCSTRPPRWTTTTPC